MPNNILFVMKNPHYIDAFKEEVTPLLPEYVRISATSGVSVSDFLENYPSC